jgi:hypothetical protein
LRLFTDLIACQSRQVDERLRQAEALLRAAKRLLAWLRAVRLRGSYGRN